MALFDRFLRRKAHDAERAQGNDYYALYDSQRPLDIEDELSERPAPRFSAGSPDYDDWDSRLSQLDGAVATEEQRRAPWWHKSHWTYRKKRWWAVRILAAMALGFFAIVAWLAITAPLSKSLEPIAAPQITLLASDGTPIARSGAMVAEPVELEDLPPHVTQAFIAIEDRRFYSHWGVDPRGIARAAWTGRGGGSTITQQLAKFTFLTPEQSLSRKAREALIAFWLETWLTKEEILERYLSNAYFGDNQYGLRAASLHYFYRQPENLLPQQAAMLAGLLQAPSRYAPTRHYERAKARMDLVVGAMVEEGYLTRVEADALPAPRIDSRTRNDLPTGTYFADWALPIARRQTETGYASQVLTTTLDARLQALASRVVARAGLGEAQVGLVAMRPTGEVVAMVGGKSYSESPFNRVTQARRQPGSTFKMFVYLAALEAGWDVDDTIPNTPIEAGSYRPKNYGGKYTDEITLEEALATSSNVATVRLFNELGSERVIRTARAMGVTSPLPEGDPSLALGTSTMTLLELTSAYAGLAANEFPVEPYAFEPEEPSWGEWLWELFTTKEDSVSSTVHAEMEQMLRRAINKGTGRAATLPIANYGKTGTTQDSRDALFVGYAGEGEDELVVGVWVGNDDNSSLGKVTGGTLPARIWKDFMRGALSLKAAPKPKPTSAPDPQGPIQPFDLEDGAVIPLDDNGSQIRLDQDGITLDAEIDGVPVRLRIDENGELVSETDEP
ncbi:MAG: transglycosylase domain-containing protein [Erythrobacter sp.]|uniref:transglycosylase domain-containing protein n=1 Tax=Erythrobacter sp. TaxID=1042 RepID=UPI0026292391|nr:transglycosylase domain-containing protein [Erythrobacter sp.]MDJ0977043.1 transglycosylase domain-containing protein [Erythrobacter sp.]